MSLSLLISAITMNLFQAIYMFDANSLLRTFMLLVLLALGGCASLPDNSEIAGRMADQFDARID